MTAIFLDLTIEQGADYQGVFTILSPDGSPLNLAGYAAAMQIKYAPDYPYAVLTLTSANGGLVINASAGTVTPVIPASVTTTLNPIRYVYDLKLVSPADLTTRAYQGAVFVSAEVTDVVISPPADEGAILLETNGYLLLENGGRILLENQ
jgi:hypothetical protein